MNRNSFGRRSSAQPPQQRRQAVAQSIAPADIAPVSLPIDLDMPSVEDEVQAWKRERAFVVPWRQLSLMASLCFGIASFVLPSSVNDWVDWLLYGLSAVSLYVGLSKRFRKPKS
jgi:hypothetical protein